VHKHIVVCSDGTGNTAVKGRGTNVFKIFESVDLNSHRYNAAETPQIAIYDDGVGTESFKPLKLLGGVAGYGLSRNVRQLYKELCRVYDPGDKVFLFGFSRGAFTVRTLAGLISTCGILKLSLEQESAQLEQRVDEAYALYRQRYRTVLMRLAFGEPDDVHLQAWKDRHSYGGEKIAFIGVWDTVDAVGLPLPIADLVNRYVYQFKFPSLTLCDNVEHACHALALDDERQSFHPLLWDQPMAPAASDQVLEQVWFAGAHSNVGGGYPKQGMSLVALHWMMERAQSAGLRFIREDLDRYQRHLNVDDKLYDPRSGFGILYRWKPRDVAQICSDHGVEPKVHLSVLERAAHGTEDYSPGNLPAGAELVFTSTGDPAQDAVAQARTRELQRVLATNSGASGSLLDTVARQVRIGRISHQVFMLSVAALLLIGSMPLDVAWDAQSFSSASHIAFQLLTSPLQTLSTMHGRLWAHSLLAVIPLLGLGLAFVMAVSAKRRRQRVFSSFWFAHQQRLRKGLKRARAASIPPPSPTGVVTVSGPVPVSAQSAKQKTG